MPGYDPLESIMGALRGANSIDPASAAQRQAEMKQERRRAGAAPTVRRRPAGASPVPERPSPEEGTETAMTAPQTTIPIIIDALNESIIALKVEIHRTTDPERRKSLERQANKLREQIQELGGEPVWADESVEQGLAKLTGQGFIGQYGLHNLFSSSNSPLSAGVMNSDILWQRSTGVAPQRQTSAPAAQTTPAASVKQTAPSYPQPSGATGGPFMGPHDRALTGRFSNQTQPPQEYTDRLSELLNQIGSMGYGGYSSAPAPMVDPDYVNQVLAEYGVKPRSPEEIQAHAHAIVERMKYGQEKIIRDELDRFERENPPEFARAQEKIQQAAATISADKQEEFSNRGMFYSSVMGSALGELDAKTLDLISEIATDAASYVMGLRQDLRDIAEWAVLEEEVLRRELETEDRALRERLANLRIQVAMWSDEMALNRWATEQQIRIEQQKASLQAAALQLEQSLALGDRYAAAYLADYPEVASELRRMGYSAQVLSSMPVDQKAALVTAVMQGKQYSLDMEQSRLTNTLTALEITKGEWQVANLPKSLTGEDEEESSPWWISAPLKSLWEDPMKRGILGPVGGISTIYHFLRYGPEAMRPEWKPPGS